MKRIVCVLVTLIMLAGMMSTMVNSAGTLVFSDDFEEGFVPRNWITDKQACAFEWDKYARCIQGYEAARVLQSNYDGRFDKKWDKYYGKIDFQIRGFDDIEPAVDPHTVRIWYRDLFESETLGAIYEFGVEVETGRAYITKSHTYKYYDDNGVSKENTINAVIAEGQINGTIEVGEDAPWYELGLRVTDGKLEGYFEQQLCVSIEAKDDDEKVGNVAVNSVDSTVGSQKSPFILINGKKESASWIAFDNFEVWTPDYDFVVEDPIVYGDVNNDTAVNLSDVSMMLQYIAKWEIADFNEKAADVNGDDTVNLTDVSKMLQVIAKWEGVVLGPTE